MEPADTPASRPGAERREGSTPSGATDYDFTSAATITPEVLWEAMERIEAAQYEPHRCIVHPKGGICFECGRYWSKRNLDEALKPF